MVNEREIDSCPTDNKEQLTILSSVPIKKKNLSMETTNELSTQVRGCNIWWGHNGTNKDHVMYLPYVCNFVSLISLVHMQRSWIISYLLLMECRLIESLIFFFHRRRYLQSPSTIAPAFAPWRSWVPERWDDLTCLRSSQRAGKWSQVFSGVQNRGLSNYTPISCLKFRYTSGYWPPFPEMNEVSHSLFFFSGGILLGNCNASFFVCSYIGRTREEGI